MRYNSVKSVQTNTIVAANRGNMHIEKPVVVLLRHTADPERVVAASARLCYSDANIEQISENMTPAQIERLLNVCVSQGHHSVFEHASFTYGIEGVSRAMTHQLVRHRIASFSQQSQRYVKFDDVGCIVPPQIEANEKAKQLFLKALNETEKAYKELAASGVAPEDARYILPNAAATKITVTMNARELRHFFELRCCNRAQWEIRAVATEMLILALKVAPMLFKGCGPACRTGACKEGKMSCGRIEEVRKYFADIEKEMEK